MRSLIPASLILSFILVSCSNAPSLWGTYSTPTPNLPQFPTAFENPEEVGELPAAIPSSTTTTLSMTEQIPLASPTPPAGSLPESASQTPTIGAAPILYYAQSGDTLAAVARRFNVIESEISSSASVFPTGLIDPGTLLVIPDRIDDQTTPNIQLLPDNEIIFSATAVDFTVEEYIGDQQGYLSNFRDYLGSSGWIDGDKAIRKLAYDNSINPRLLLAILEYESRWVRDQPVDLLHTNYPMGYQDFRVKGLSLQMNWAINQIFHGYYGWRAGTLTELVFEDGTHLRFDPRLNAGTVAIQYLFSRFHSQTQWAQIIDPESGFPAMYVDMFGDPWARADLVNPIFPPGLSQPPMVLPFEPDVEWNFISGPHGAWLGQERNDKGVFEAIDFNLAALDFGPSTAHGGCEVTPTWVVAAMPGLVVRADNGVVVIDADGDGHEQTGWDLFYLHISTKDRIKAGTWVEVDQRIGHASCEGGVSKGTHTHIARKFNGEWIAADGPIPFILSGWRTVAGEKPYLGKLVKGDRVITASEVGEKWSNIFREMDDEDINTTQ